MNDEKCYNDLLNHYACESFGIFRFCFHNCLIYQISIFFKLLLRILRLFSGGNLVFMPLPVLNGVFSEFDLTRNG